MSKDINPSELSMEDVLDKCEINDSTDGRREVFRSNALAAMKEWASIQNSELLGCLKAACQDFEDQIHATEKKLGGMISWVGPDWYNKARDLLRKQNLK